MISRDLIATRAKAFENLEDPIARLQQLVTVVHKFQETVLEYRPEVAEMLTPASMHISRVIEISDDDYEALNFITLELVFAVRALNKQYFGPCEEGKAERALGARS